MEAPIASTSTANGHMNGATAGEERQIAIRLSTKDAQYSVPPTKFLVPASWKRYHLSELINKVLENASPVPFDFLIASTLLRSSLGEYCASSGTSEEETLEIEYLPSTLPPKLSTSLPSEDWVSEVSLSLPGTILTSSYAGTLSLHSPTFPAPQNITFNGHDLSALTCCHVDLLPGSGKSFVASGGMDRLGRIWEYEARLCLACIPTATCSLRLQIRRPQTPQPLSDVLPIPKTLYTLPLHTAPISSIRSRPSSSHLLSASWDGIIGLWDLTPGSHEGPAEIIGATTDENAAPRRKKRKVMTGGETVIPKVPVSVLRGHAGKISRAIFDRSDSKKAYSTGWDHTVRTWDLETGSEASSKTSDKVFLSLTQFSSPNLLGSGTTDRLITIFDLLDTSSTISLSLTGHSGPVSSVASHPTNPRLCVSASYDSTVRVWDLRSPKQALFVLNVPDKEGVKQEEKLLSVDWDGDRIVAGGEGKRVVVWRVGAEGVLKG